MRATAAVATVTVILATALSGCGSDSRGAIKAKVHEFADAVATHDYRTICDDVLAPSLLADFLRGGIRCEQALRIALGHVRAPRLAAGPVTLSGNTASVLAISQASGERSVLTSLRLVDTKNGWRISSLGSPVGGS